MLSEDENVLSRKSEDHEMLGQVLGEELVPDLLNSSIEESSKRSKRPRVATEEAIHLSKV